MVGVASREMTVGSLISETMELVQDNFRAVLIAIAILTVCGGITDYAEVLSGSAVVGIVSQIAFMLFGFVVQYLLLEVFLKQVGMLTAGQGRPILAYVGLIIVMFLGTTLGMLLLIVPGVILAVRWSLAGPLLICEKGTVVEAIAKSWDITKGYTVTLLLTMLLVFIPIFVLLFGAILLLGESSLISIIIAQLVGNVSTVAGAVFPVAALDILYSRRGRMTAVFE